MKLIVATVFLATFVLSSAELPTQSDAANFISECKATVTELQSPECVFTKLGMFDKMTGFNVERSIVLLRGGSSLEKTQEVVNNCAVKRLDGENVYNWAYRGYECFIAAEFMMRFDKKE